MKNFSKSSRNNTSFYISIFFFLILVVTLISLTIWHYEKLDQNSQFVKSLKTQLVDQKNWSKNNSQDIKEVTEHLKVIFEKYYHQFLQIVKTEENPKNEWEEPFLKPEQVLGELTTSTNFSSHVSYCKNKFLKDRKLGPCFWGFVGFMDDSETEKAKKQEKNILGVTNSIGKREKPIGEGKLSIYTDEGKVFYTPRDPNTSLCCYSYRDIDIKLNKELLFNRYGHDKWITKFSEKGNSVNWSYSNISWNGGLIETIAHELAHAVIDSIIIKYNEWEEKRGKIDECCDCRDNDGHGPLHKKFTKRIKEMLEQSPEVKNFEKLWKKK